MLLDINCRFTDKNDASYAFDMKISTHRIHDNRLIARDFFISSHMTSRIEWPFTIFECENFFPEELYRQLVADFPIDALRAKMKPGEFNARIDQKGHPKEFAEVLRDSPAWLSVLGVLSSPEFVRDLRFQFRNELLQRSRPSVRWFRRVLSWIDLPRARVKFDFVLSKGGFHLTPHTDGSKKLIAMIIYLPSAGQGSLPDAMATHFWSEAQSPGTDSLSVGPSGVASRRLPRVLRDGNEADQASDALKAFMSTAVRVMSTRFVDNTISGFVKSNNSWHSVDLSHVPFDAERCTVLVNLNVADPPRSILWLSGRLKRVLKKLAGPIGTKASFLSPSAR